MNNIEDKLKDLPKARLGYNADRNLKIKLIGKIARKEMLRMSSYYYFRRRVLVTVAVAAFMLLIVVAPSYAYASKNVTVGHFLFPVKNAIETVEYTVSTDKPSTLLKFSLRRIEEAEILAGDDDQENNVMYLMNDARRLKTASEIRADKPSQEQLEKYQEKGDFAIKKIAEKIGLESGDAVIDAVALMIEKVKKEDTKIEETDIEREDIEEPAVEKEEKPIQKIINEPVAKPEEVKKPIEAPKKTEPIIEQPKTDVKKPSTSQTAPKVKAPVKQQPKIEQKSQVFEKEKEIVNLKNEVKKLETSLVNDDYKKEEVDKIVEQINKRIEKAENEESDKKSKQIIEPAKALTDNAEYFVKKEDKGSSNEKPKNNDNNGGKNEKKK